MVWEKFSVWATLFWGMTQKIAHCGPQHGCVAIGAHRSQHHQRQPVGILSLQEQAAAEVAACFYRCVKRNRGPGFSFGSGALYKIRHSLKTAAADGDDLCSADHTCAITLAQITHPHWRDSGGQCVFVDFSWLIFLEILKIQSKTIENAVLACTSCRSLNLDHNDELIYK